uniref:Uncharacterized protein n=1 Tax=Romanomermis culicivorax TaxID=13658 RepID=A0A915KST4_ROMCU
MNGLGLKTKIPPTLLHIEQLQKSYFQSIEANDLEAVNDFIIKNVSTNKIPLDARNESGETPLTVSARLGRIQLVDFLIRCGSDVDAKDLVLFFLSQNTVFGRNHFQELWSPLLNAAKEGFLEIVQLLVNAEADIEQPDVGGWTPLYWACYKNRLSVVKFLIQSGAEVNISDEYGMAPILWVSGRGYAETLKELVDAGARTDCRDRFGNNPLFWACKKGSFDEVNTLLCAGSPIDVVGVF